MKRGGLTDTHTATDAIEYFAASNRRGARPAARAATSTLSTMAASRLARTMSTLAWLPVGAAASDVMGVPARVTDARMAPALAPGDVALVDRLSCRLYRFQRGDVVQLK